MLLSERRIPLGRRLGLWLRLLDEREIYALIIGVALGGWTILYWVVRFGAIF